MKKILSIMALAVACMATAFAGENVVNVQQVTEAVTLTDDVDYIVSGTTPFSTAGSINIQNTEHAVVILSSIKPSKVISSWLSHIYVNGAQAVNDENCQVKMYNRGAIILPYDKNIRPLTCYTEPNYEGEMCDNYTEGSSGGFMKTLTTTTLNNQIRSFKLKRGYMVTFALGTSGWGYSRCFIADQEDLEVPTMPTNMDGRISSYRLFKWHNAHKAGLASNGNSAANQALNTSWCYDWAQGNASNLPDVEWVPNHIYEDYPSSATCGGVTGSCHMKTNNEPRNTADDHPQELETILNNWPNLMRTGMRLCTPSSWDGSDYWNGTGFIKTFLDSIDARGWRCDIVDAHCYWNEANFGYLSSQWFTNMKRPIWISEWIWGSSWGQNGAFASGVTDADILATTKRILENLNSMDCVERYAYWNSESKAHIYENGSLTELGKYYASMETGLGYKKSNEFVPRVIYSAPKGLTGTYAQAKGTFTMTWNDDNGDMLDSISVECKLPGATRWVRLATLPLKDKSTAAGAAYSYIDTLSAPGAYYYRVGSYPIGNKTAKYSDEVSVTVSSSQGNAEFQYGNLSVTNTEAIATSFSERFSETPAIFMGICSNQNATLYPGNLITSASSTKFNYQILPWTEQSNGVTELAKAEEIPFMAMKAGNYKYGGLDCEVGVAKVNKDTTEITFQQPFPEGVTPIVLAELRNPTLKANAIAINIWDVTNTGFKAMLQYEEGLGKAISVLLNTCYLAITPGMGHICTRSLLRTDTVRVETLHPDSRTDSIVYTLRHTYQTQPIACVVAGTGENNMYGVSARSCTFAVGTDTLYFQSPKMFGKCQTNKYPAAAILRKSTEKKITDSTSELYNYIYGANIKRQVDGTSTTTAKNTSANSDVLGYVVLGEPQKTAEEEIVEEITYTVQERTTEYTDEYKPIAGGAFVNTVDLSSMGIDWRNISDEEFAAAMQQIDWANVEALTIPENSTERIIPYLSKAVSPKLRDLVVLETTLPVAEMQKVDYGANVMVRMPEGTTPIDASGNIVAAPDNVFIGGKAERVVLTDRTPYVTGYSYKGGNYFANQIVYTRTFGKATSIGKSGGWEALVLPFNVAKITAADGRTLAPFGSTAQADANFWLAELTADGFQPATSIKAGKPYIIAMPNSSEYDAQYNITGDVTFSATNDSLYNSLHTLTQGYNGMVFTPNYYDIAQTDAADMFTLNDETYQTYLPGGAFVRGLRAVRPFEAYVTQSAGAKPRRVLPIVLPEPTALYQIAAEKAQKTDGVIYDLTGRRVAVPARGLYIKNGRKVLVK